MTKTFNDYIIYAPINIIYTHIDIYQYDTHKTQYLYTHKYENEIIQKIVSCGLKRTCAISFSVWK